MKPVAPHFRLILVLTLLPFLFISCARETEVGVGGGSTPLFTMKGSAKLTSFKVWGPKPGEPDGKATELIWQLEPASTGQSGVALDTLQQIQYGVVPAGFVQRTPAVGSPGPPVDGITYQAEIGTGQAPVLNLRFTVRNGQTVNAGAASNLHNIPTH